MYQGTFKFLFFALMFCTAGSVFGQSVSREFSVAKVGSVEITNHFGRVTAAAVSAPAGEDAGEKQKINVSLRGTSDENDLTVDASSGRLKLLVEPKSGARRVDLVIEVPERSSMKVETRTGEVFASGNFERLAITTETGTIAVDVPTTDVRYDLNWTTSRPRYLSDIELSNVKEKSGGKFQIKGRFRSQAETGEAAQSDNAETSDSEINGEESKNKDNDKKKESVTVALDLATERGIMLINVPPNEVSSDLRERPLTNAAKAIIRSGDTLLMDAIRRASPKYFGDYARTLPPARLAPSLVAHQEQPNTGSASTKRAVVRVMDSSNRAIAGLRPEDFEVTENGDVRDILDVRPVTAPFNLVLLLDVSGSVDNYVNFIRKAARNFVETVDRNDRVSIVLFNEDVNVLSGFTTDKQKLSASLDSFEAGGGTAYYDAVAYTLADTLRPLKGERTAIVILTDGDDNRSFLSFDSLLGSIQESGALIYPLYVPSSLIAASGGDPNAEIDPLRQRYMTLNSKAEGEGEKLAKESGGIYYPITQLSHIQRAYNDIVVQLRTAYDVKFASRLAETGTHASPRLKVRVKRDNAFVSIGPVVSVDN